MHKYGLMLLAGLLATCGLARPAAAIKSFQVEFEKLYVGEESDTELGKLFAEKKMKKVRCLVCHQGKKKKVRNAYGIQLSDLLDKKKDKKDKEKIIEALKIVAEMKSNPEDSESPTFGEIIAEGKLPGGTLEDLKKNPESSEEPKDSEEKEPEEK